MSSYIPYIAFLKKLLANILPPPSLFSLKKTYYARAVRSFWEADAEPIKYLVKPGDFVLDIGANVGWYTRILASLVGEKGRVYGVEPIPETFDLLSAITKKLRLLNVQLIRCGISETDSWALMEVPLYDHGGPNFYLARIAESLSATSSLPKYAVELRSIDSLFLDLAENIAFIKCDVEGHELAVVKGAVKFLGRSTPSWLIEVSGDPDAVRSPSAELFDRLIEQNYVPYWFDGQKLNKRSPGDKAINYFFLQAWQVKQASGLMRSRRRRGQMMTC